MSADPYAWLDPALTTIARAGWSRQVQTVQGRPGPVIQLDGQPLINFGSNDYLGLAGDERLIQAAVTATQELGTGSTGSRLITGHRQIHQQLEQAIADLKQTEAALVFSSGYLANTGTIAALVGRRDLILTDQYNHSSLKQGGRLSGATVVDYGHCDMADLRHQLAQQRPSYRRCLILSDTVFSMDGDLCPLPELLALAREFEAMVLVDEAHATGVMGLNGAGCVEHFRCSDQVIQIGTLSKALGSLGGYVAGSARLIDYLRNRCPTWIYTTGLSAADTAAALMAVSLVRQEPQRRQQLWQNVSWLQQRLQARLADPAYQERVKLLPSQSPIICLQFSDVETVMAVGKQLRQQGVFAPAVRPPTVPTSRLRLTLMATHKLEHLNRLLIALDHTL